MAALVCDICGGKLKVINGKMAVCESCGMEHSIERVREKYKESQSVVHVDNAHLIDNYYAMAQDAYDAGNKEEAERYCNKIIEVDPGYAEALLLKGKAVGWQSSIGSFRFKEAALCFANAINAAATDTESEEIHESVEEEFRGLATALIKLRCDRFEKWPDYDEARGFKNDLDEIAEAVSIYIEQTKKKIDKNRVFENVSTIVQLCMSLASMTILLEYRANGTRRAYSAFKDKVDNCIDIMKKTIDLCDDDDDSDVQLYEKSIDMLEMLIKQNTTDQVQNRWGAFINTPRLSDSEVSRIQQKINEYRTKISKLI